MTNTSRSKPFDSRFSGNDEAAPKTLPLSEDELILAYAMIASLYRMVLRWARNDIYDDQARSIAESAERLLLRTDVVQRLLRIAWSERRQEIMLDHIELLEQQKQRLMLALAPFADLAERTQNDPDWEQHIATLLDEADLSRAQVIYKGLSAASKPFNSRESDATLQ